MWCDILLWSTMILHLLLAPYTKVEESFNVQSIHDLLYTNALEDYDHLEFSGVVPRTFVGPVILASIVRPIRLLLSSVLGWSGGTSVTLLVRFILGATFQTSFYYLRQAFAAKWKDRKLSDCIAVVSWKWRNFLISLSCFQFHLLFYSTRPLANTFAAVLVNLGLAYLVLASLKFEGGTNDKEKYAKLESEREKAGGLCVTYLALTCILFRCDMIILAGPMLVCAISYGWIRVGVFFKYGVITSLIGIVSSVLLDSYYWRRLVWPELEVLYFNTLAKDENGEMFMKAAQWGVEPWYWYFLRALPKSLLATGLLLPFAMFERLPTTFEELWRWRQECRIDWEVMKMLLPSFLFIFLYSFLAHKELRFIYPLLPFLTCLCGLGYRKLVKAVEESQNRISKRHQAKAAVASHAASKKSISKQAPVVEQESSLLVDPMSARSFRNILLLGFRGIQLALFLSLGIVFTSLYVSSWNYPGGEAFHRFHLLTQPICRDILATPQGKVPYIPLVHISNLAATTGVSRFGQRNECFRYSKQEGLKTDEMHLHPFDFLLSEVRYVPGFDLLAKPLKSGVDLSVVECFTRMEFKGLFHLPPVEMHVEPQLWLLRRTVAYVPPSKPELPTEVEVEVD